MAEISLNELNKLAQGDLNAFINEEEEKYRFRIEGLADYVKENEKIRIVLLAGPSGSGKTTSANLLADAIRKRGEECIVVSLDDFYKGASDPTYPRRPGGERDYECPEALRLEEISNTLSDIAEGRSFILPKYDFKVGDRVSETRCEAMPSGCVIIEGLHALNPKIYSSVNTEQLLRLFVSVSTNINEGDERILSGRKLRFVRRMVRDSIYRAATAERTLDMWREVLAAEDVYLYPYKESADLAFNTFHAFEPGVMRPFALNLIDDALAEANPYAKTVRDALLKVKEIDHALIPETSLIKEFIPGGIYENLY